MIILGLDPGLATTGYAFAQAGARGDTRAVEWGVITTPPRQALPNRLRSISEDIDALIGRHRPNRAIVETLYFAKNSTTAIAVAHARGAILAALARNHIPVLEMTPRQLKSQITSYGQASKSQMQAMVQKIFRLPKPPRPDDAADALALAWCGCSNSYRAYVRTF